ncbi:ATP phosphoribosyltransferase [Kwoniella mangroviensis CBS 10435]|uniref:ATP phosphoribosyltransferase n=1 Tax=Kwoniella mangroviensis CBS 10435 TaxID=1331196 RepID=A0A1B9IU49_9TREE|nr:ATP phosphoribosyltransferase [Kwoniella mangroviensis CBS 8507]OCF59069.1 ATP phosphoribosyltransferase [Kwoniella mangroviensis CBS 10435]OCF68864.1 ATP phosphoribosyltransferase [Kwoniella mangroviensis CBS 8507]OCF76675.1 ATP phosphoribosyltransferase [Kwoniella mangroviensis CBS 8886]
MSGISSLLPSTTVTPQATEPSAMGGRASKSSFGAESTMSLLVDSLKDRLLFAVPKKGRLMEKTLELLAGADIKYNRAHRLDVALVQNHPIALVFLPAADIPRFVALGSVALGITGQDVIAESTHSEQIEELLQLGFGKCSLQVQVPVTGPIQTVEGLSGGRIATSFEVLAGELFNGKEGVDSKTGKQTKVEYVGGSVEAACALGMADGIVDLVESGDTMRAAGLHAIHTLMKSEAVLITSKTPHPSLTPDLQSLIPLIKSRFAGVLASKKYVYASYNIERKYLDKALVITPGRRAATVSPLETEGWVAVSSMVERKEVAKVMDELEKTGAEDILIFALDNCRVGV